MNAVLKYNEGETRYEIFVDEYDLQSIFECDGSSFDFGDEKENEKYMNKFKKGDLCSFGVVKMQVCKCCCMWSEVDSVWGIHEESPEEAFKFYKKELSQTA
jgi:hypothetical protein